MKRLYNTAVISLLALLSACSTLERREYFAPSCPSATIEWQRYPYATHFSGSPDSLVVSNQLVSLQCSVRPIDIDVLTIGPPYIPVIPVFPIDWLIEMFSDQQTGLLIRLEFQAVEQLTMNVDFTKCILKLDTGQSLIPIAGQQWSRWGMRQSWSDTPPLASIVVAEPYSVSREKKLNRFWADLYFYPVPAHATNCTLYLEGLRPITPEWRVPPIQLSRQKSWQMSNYVIND